MTRGAVATAGCQSTEPTEGSSDMGTDQQDLTVGAEARAACGAAKFDSALPHYKAAVVGAKIRLAGKTCEDDGVNGSTADQIADNAARAVLICPAFTNVIKRSPFAQPIRQTLSNVLTLRSLTGELLVLRDSPFQNWTNVESYFPGTSLWSNFEFGILSIPDRLDFSAGGQGSHVHIDETGQEIVIPFTYRIEKVADEKSPRRVVITENGNTVAYNLIVAPSASLPNAPVFKLRETELDHFDPEQGYTSMQSECDA